MIQLVTLNQAKSHLNETSSYFDQQIDMNIWGASAIMLDYLKVDLGSPEQLPWPTVPYEIQAAVLLMVGTLFRQRETDADVLSEPIKALVHRHRNMTMA